MSSDQIKSPYAPPSDAVGQLERECPSCRETMQDGDLTSGTTIRWRGKSTSALQTFLVGGDKIGDPKSGFGYRLPAYFCSHCRLIQIKP
ncbi:MAG: hypothetical protein HKN47_25635 [Pirellulaceae bacterium]|nr:hypothetical protein [Pirellulaceae bacterium]